MLGEQAQGAGARHALGGTGARQAGAGLGGIGRARGLGVLLGQWAVHSEHSSCFWPCLNESIFGHCSSTRFMNTVYHKFF